MKLESKSLLMFVVVGVAACGGPPAGTDAGSTPDTATVTDSGSAADVTADVAAADVPEVDAGAADTGSSIPVMNACTPDAYMDMSTGTASDRMIMLNAAHQFDMPCMTINAHQAVMFMWALSTYPIAPGLAPSHMSDTAGTDPSPIQMRSTGSVYTVTFPTAGFYPFYVTGHDATLLGVIQVQ